MFMHLSCIDTKTALPLESGAFMSIEKLRKPGKLLLRKTVWFSYERMRSNLLLLQSAACKSKYNHHKKFKPYICKRH